MDKIKSYKDLILWKKAYELTLIVYKATSCFPKIEMYGISDQMRRAAVSVPSNIAEGYHRQHTGEYVQFLSIAHGSLAELETQTLLSYDLGYIKENEFKVIQHLENEIGKMLMSLTKVLSQRK